VSTNGSRDSSDGADASDAAADGSDAPPSGSPQAESAKGSASAAVSRNIHAFRIFLINGFSFLAARHFARISDAADARPRAASASFKKSARDRISLYTIFINKTTPF